MKWTYTLLLILLIHSSAFCGEWDLESLCSTTHTIRLKSKDTRLEIQWEAQESATWHSFLTTFSSPSPVTMNDDYEGDYDTVSVETISGVWKGVWTKSITIDDPGTTPYYFNMCIVDIEGDPHPITSIGPYFIDSEAPNSPSINAPEYTPSPIILLSNIGAIDSVQMCLSNTGYGIGCNWENIESYKLWIVNEGDGIQTTIYAQFRDDVWNIATASASTTYSSTAAPDENLTVPTLNEWGIIILGTLLFFYSFYIIKKEDQNFQN